MILIGAKAKNSDIVNCQNKP